MPLERLETAEAIEKFQRKHPFHAIHFSAKWNKICEDMDTALEALLEEKLVPAVGVIDAEQLPSFAYQHKVTAAPTVFLFKKQKAVYRLEGFRIQLLREALAQHSSTGSLDVPVTEQKVETDLNKRLEELTKSHPLMLFMKGNPEAPRCGFSRTIVGLLNDLNAKFGSFDILSDEDVRQGLKEFSKWPTYPQVYLNGEFIGGLDVFKEEIQDPEFVSQLPKKA